MASTINYPYPVLSIENEDYIDSFFDIEFTVDPRIEGQYAYFNVKYLMACEGLESMIANDEATVMVQIVSVLSGYRKTFAFSQMELEQEIQILNSDISNSVVIKGYVVANMAKSNFKLAEHNSSIFETIPFNIREGDILAVSANTYSIPLDSYDPLADRPSIFSIRRETTMIDDITVNLEDHKIKIFLSNELFEKYQHIYQAPETRTILATMFATPVLVDVLNIIKHANEDEEISYNGKKWYDVITYKLKELDIDLANESSLTKVANMILPHVFNNFVDTFSNVFENILPSGGEET